MCKLPESISSVSSSGTLSDRQIRLACASQILIDENFCDASVKQACYELRASNTYFELNHVRANTTPRKHVLEPGKCILIKPRQAITVITQESLRLPADVLGRVLSKGQLFSIGVVPVNTYADPGFKGPLGITLANFSNNYLRIEQGDPIAKIEFSTLSESVESAYRGQHGYRDQMWPVPYHMVASAEQLRDDERVGEFVEELAISHGDAIADLAQKVFKYHCCLVVLAVAYSFISLALLWWLRQSESGTEWVLSFGVNVLAGFATCAVTVMVTVWVTYRKGKRWIFGIS